MYKKNLYQKKDMCYFLQKRMRVERKAWILFGISFLIIVAYYFLRYEHIQYFCFTCKTFIDFLRSCKELMYVISVSVFSGMIVYGLTVCVVSAKKANILCYDVSEELRYFKDEFHELSNTLCDCDWTISPFDPNRVYSSRKESFESQYKNENIRFLEEFMLRFDKHIDNILPFFVEHMSVSEIQCLVNLKHCHIFQVLRKIRSEQNRMFTQNEIVKMLSEANKIVILLHDKLSVDKYKD